MSGARSTGAWRAVGLAVLVGAVALVFNPWVAAVELQAPQAVWPVPRQAVVLDALPLAEPQHGRPPEFVTGPATFTIEGLNFETDRAVADTNNYWWRIPEPHGAAGPGHIVSTVSGAITWHTKAGVLQNTQLLAMGNNGSSTGSFFASLSPASEGAHPRVLYDQYAERFVVVLDDWTAISAGDTADSSSILLAVSDDSDPNGTWYYHKINSMATIGGQSCLAYELSVAVVPDAIFITVDYVNFALTAFTGSRLFIIQKTPFYTGGTAVVNMYDPSTAAGFLVQVLKLLPAHTFGIPPAGVVTYLVSPGYYNPLNGEDLLAVIAVYGTAAAPTFPAAMAGFLDLEGHISNHTFGYTAPQPGTTHTINVRGPGSALWRDNNLYVAYTHAPVSGPNAGQATVHWLHWNISAGTLAQADVGGEEIAPATSTFYPSVAVNSQGSMAIGFMASGPNLYPGAYYTGRLAGDPPGTTDPPRPVAAGVDYYYRVFAGTDDSYNVLGPCSATVVDPLYDTFWTFNAYALTRGTIFLDYPTQDGRWGTRCGSFAVTSAPGDFDGNGHVDAGDLLEFAPCLTGPGVPYILSALPEGCSFSSDAQGIIPPDFDRDGDVDQDDFGIFQRCFTGPSPAIATCAD